MYQHFNITDINVLKLGPHIKKNPFNKAVTEENWDKDLSLPFVRYVLTVSFDK